MLIITLVLLTINLICLIIIGNSVLELMGTRVLLRGKINDNYDGF